jgi:hypothetical protein
MSLPKPAVLPSVDPKADTFDWLLFQLALTDAPAEIQEAASQFSASHFKAMYPELRRPEPHLAWLVDNLKEIILKAENEVPTNAEEKSNYVVLLRHENGTETLTGQNKTASASLSILLRGEKTLDKAKTVAAGTYLDPTYSQEAWERSFGLVDGAKERLSDFLNNHSELFLVQELERVLIELCWDVVNLLTSYFEVKPDHRWSTMVTLEPYLHFLSGIHEGHRKMLSDQMLELVREHKRAQVKFN